MTESILDFVNRFNDDRYPVQTDLSIGSVGGTRNRASWRKIPFVSGSDHDLFNALKIGATTLTAWPDDYYHSSEDTLDKVDPTQLHRAVVMGLAAVTTLAYGRRRIAQSEFSAIRSLMSATEAEIHAARVIPLWIAGKELFPFEYVQRTLAKDPSAGMKDIEAAFEDAGQRLRKLGVNELMLYGIQDAPALYVDGKRSILAIRDALAAEYTSIPIEALDLYIRAFEKAGLMKILEKTK